MAPRDDDKAIDGLLRRSLAREQGAGGPCPELDVLAAYFERTLDADEMASHELHFSQCARCREQLALILRAKTLVEIPAAQVLAVAAAAAPRFKAASAAASAPGSQKRTGIRVLDWRWLAPVAAAIVVVVFLYLRDTSRVASLRPPSAEVAMSRHADVPQPGVADTQSGTQPLTPLPAAPHAEQLQSPKMTNNGAAKPAQRPNEKESDLPSNARAEYQLRDDLRKRAEANTATAMERTASPETGASSTAKKASNDSAQTVEQPAAIPAPPPPSLPQLGAIAGGAGAGGVAAQNGTTSATTSTVMSKKAQTPKTAGAPAADKLAVTSQLMEAKSAATVIQTPDAGVQYRIAGAGAVERSQDGGTTWQGQFLNSNARILAGAAPSKNVCWLVGRAGTILLSTDGMKWNAISPPTLADFVEIVATDGASATVTAADGRKFSTVDGGNTWKLLK
jgi:hypothetical protein